MSDEASSKQADLSLLKQVKALLNTKKAEDGKGRFDELVYAEKLLGVKPLSAGLRCVGDDWYVYDAGAWLPRTREEFGPVALSVIPREYRTARAAANLLEHVQTKCQVRADSLMGFNKMVTEEDGSKSILLNVANGVLKLWAGGEVTMERHSQEHGFTSKSAASYDENKVVDCPLFKRIIAGALPEPADTELLQFAAGNFLWPTTQFEACLIMYGLEGTGKSKIAQAMMNTLVEPESHSDLVTNLSMHQICDSKGYSLYKLAMAAVNLGTEVSTIDMDDSSNFKIVVSGEKLDARQIYGRPLNMIPRAKLVFLANTLPVFKNGTGAEFRRLRFLHFKVLVPEDKKDTNLEYKLRAEREGIFRWMVDGLIKLQSSGAIPLGGTDSQAVAAKFAISNDPVGYFVKNCCEMDATAKEFKSDIEAAYGNFLEEQGLHRDKMLTWFFRRLYERFSDVKPVRSRESAASKEVVRFVRGLRLKSDDGAETA